MRPHFPRQHPRADKLRMPPCRHAADFAGRAPPGAAAGSRCAPGPGRSPSRRRRAAYDARAAGTASHCRRSRCRPAGGPRSAASACISQCHFRPAGRKWRRTEPEIGWGSGPRLSVAPRPPQVRARQSLGPPLSERVQGEPGSTSARSGRHPGRAHVCGIDVSEVRLLCTATIRRELRGAARRGGLEQLSGRLTRAVS